MLIGLALMMSAGGLAAQSAAEKTPDDRIYAQILVDQTVAKNPDLTFMSMHAVAPHKKESAMIACNAGPCGKKDGDEETSVVSTLKPILRPRPGHPEEFEVLLPLTAAPGTVIGVLQLVFKQRTGTDESVYYARASALRDTLASKIPSRPSLFRIPAPWMARN